MSSAVKWALVVAGLTLASPSARADEQVGLGTLLERAGTYVRQVQHDFASVIADEDYDQKQTLQQSGTRRHLRSEMVSLWIPDEQRWLWVRNVLAVDGKPVPDSRDRLDFAIGDSQATIVARLKRLRDESTRFNVGDVHRNFNDPTFTLLFLDPDVQSRFTFVLAGTERVDGIAARKVTFVEQRHPAVVQNGGADVVSRGVVWLNPDDGAVLRTRLLLTLIADGGSTTSQARRLTTGARIDVDFRKDAKITVRVPSGMQERYTNAIASSLFRTSLTPLERVECVATYSNFRKFETSGRIVPPGE